MNAVKTTIWILLFSILIIGCKKDDDDDGDSGIVTTQPIITSIVADKYVINIGGEDPAIITCTATGGDLKYVWEVDLGDIFPLNDEGSKVRFTGSECCVGEKFIKCSVSNDIGSVTDTIIINITIP